ncbi:predicted protein [Aspergillus terreus NIH2624]|uniref:C2H2-type domain-containing protein n=1 Tax=Aspergillus terreus (strain NIH 2624 / FGSC A1156) TaxID=341663 RepID=Q0C858_ASPTN|nr:uncharacterized protein ATEG_10126 [Aspergillus terreus NIH2624]EAU29575.1 predicted protein [Aspergillus terreus NIH2624]
MEAIEDEEPIYELAVECERLFVQQISKLNDEDQPNGAKVLSELSQRFAAWAAFLGVFAVSNVVFERDDFPACIATGSSDARQSSLQPSCIRIYNLDAILGAIGRLEHLGFSIRNSSMTSEVTKSRKFAETFDVASFEGLAYLSVKKLYPDVSEGLLEQLTRSMTETYSRFLHRKYRQEQFQAPRSRPRTAVPLSTNAEEPVEDSDAKSPVDVQKRESREGGGSTTTLLQGRSAHVLPISEPTSVDSQGVPKRVEKMPSPAEKDETTSILANQMDYPPPTKGSLTCEWCFRPLPTDLFEGAKWRRHVNEDFEPYICISENCSEPLVRFASSTQWMEHMLTTHGKSWHREAHVLPTWACPLCGDGHATFAGPGVLTEHLENLHTGTFTVSQVQAIVRQSQFWSPRGQDICPLCCLPVQGIHDPLSKETGDGNPQTTSRDREPQDFFGPSSSNTARLGMIASHVAGHLQGIMLLTLRLISIDVAMDVSADNQSAPGRTDDQSSPIRSFIEDISLPTDGEIDPDHDPLEHIVPDCEQVDWSTISRRYEASTEPYLEDIPLEGVASQQSGDQDYLGWDLEEFISNYPTRKSRDKNCLGQDLEEFISNPPLGAPRDYKYLDWDLEEFISNPPTGPIQDQEYLGQDLEKFIGDAPI